jgi:hypothetical protein
MIVADFDVIRVAVDKPKANAPLIVDCDGVLPLPIVLECVKAVARRDPQIIQLGCEMDVLELAHRARSDIASQYPS